MFQWYRTPRTTTIYITAPIHVHMAFSYHILFVQIHTFVKKKKKNYLKLLLRIFVFNFADRFHIRGFTKPKQCLSLYLSTHSFYNHHPTYCPQSSHILKCPTNSYLTTIIIIMCTFYTVIHIGHSMPVWILYLIYPFFRVIWPYDYLMCICMCGMCGY